jgi:hypothetical protein
MNEVARCSTRINQSSPTFKAIRTAQSEQGYVTARIASRLEGWLAEAEPAVLVPRDRF